MYWEKDVLLGTPMPILRKSHPQNQIWLVHLNTYWRTFSAEKHPDAFIFLWQWNMLKHASHALSTHLLQWHASHYKFITRKNNVPLLPLQSFSFRYHAIHLHSPTLPSICLFSFATSALPIHAKLFADLHSPLDTMPCIHISMDHVPFAPLQLQPFLLIPHYLHTYYPSIMRHPSTSSTHSHQNRLRLARDNRPIGRVNDWSDGVIYSFSYAEGTTVTKQTVFLVTPTWVDWRAYILK